MGHSNISTTMKYIRCDLKLNEIYGPDEFKEVREK